MSPFLLDTFTVPTYYRHKQYLHSSSRALSPSPQVRLHLDLPTFKIYRRPYPQDISRGAYLKGSSHSSHTCIFLLVRSPTSSYLVDIHLSSCYWTRIAPRVHLSTGQSPQCGKVRPVTDCDGFGHFYLNRLLRFWIYPEETAWVHRSTDPACHSLIWGIPYS